MADVSASRKERFDLDGYVKIDGFRSARQVNELIDNVNRYIAEIAPTAPEGDVFYEDRSNPETLKQLIRIHRHDEYFRRFFEEGEMPAVAAELLGEPVRPANMQVFIKPPGKSKATPAHQDGYYFMLEPCSALTLWLSLDDIDTENGCLKYLRGSHQDGMRPHNRSNTLGFSQGLADFGRGSDRDNEVICTAHSGDLLVHHALTVHWADENRAGNRNRRALGLVYFAKTAVEMSDKQAEYQRQLLDDLKSSGRV